MLYRALALGQGLSLLIASTGIFSSALVEQGVSLPASQSVLNYACLAVVYCILLLRRGKRLQSAWYKYAALAAVDVLANFCLVEAYRYTTLTSVTLLDCFTVPCVLLLSWLFLGAQYRVGHWVGAFVCLGGLALLVTTDRAFSSGTEAPRPLLGDSLVIAGATLYAICNVAQEKLLGDAGRIEVLGMLGLFGTFWGGALAGGLEWKALASVTWSLKVVAPFIGFNVALFSFSSLGPYALMWGGAAALNLSLLTSDLWAALARIVFFGGFTAASAAAFGCSFLLVGGGLVIYSLSGDIYQPKAMPAYEVVSHDAIAPELPRGSTDGDEDLKSTECDVEGQNLLTHARLVPAAECHSRSAAAVSEGDVELEHREHRA